jgi:hypothetical protein
LEILQMARQSFTVKTLTLPPAEPSPEPQQRFPTNGNHHQPHNRYDGGTQNDKQEH